MNLSDLETTYRTTCKEIATARLMYMTTHSTDDPTRGGLVFVGANGAKEAGHQPEVALIADAVFMMKDQIAESMTPVGFPPLKELMAIAIANRTPIHV